ncbi:hypothetical protein [Variovorax saccharolyticus]|uniref:hypothetical protein n=1 Tax=Variovorax saccharolyticus TaxID=3053516 RepID=UPI0025755F50|nr:hypothetical protein [Variovorax sp. J22R187]MDM0018374.1 hypothetical protein [Variovorax sp. J22R187]
MTIANRIAAAQALLARSRKSLEHHHAGRRTVQLDSPGIAPLKPAPARIGSASAQTARRS